MRNAGYLGMAAIKAAVLFGVVLYSPLVSGDEFLSAWQKRMPISNGTFFVAR